MGSAMVMPRGGDLLALADRLAAAAEAASEKEGLRICISVVDAHGNPVLFRRMTGSTLVAIGMAVRKAETAVALGMATADIRPLVEPGQPLYPLLAAEGGRYVAFGGGVPVTVDGAMVAALGISGGSPDQDTAIANAALQAFSRAPGVQARRPKLKPIG